MVLMRAGVATKVDDRTFMSELRATIHEGSDEAESMYFGYFLQFKVIERALKTSRRSPDHYTAPYFRAKLSLKPNRTTRISQHETLVRLGEVPRAQVYYACPMLFTSDDLHEDPVELEKLRLIDIRSAPQGWNTDEPHYIIFQAAQDPGPLWCSEPISAKATTGTLG